MLKRILKKTYRLSDEGCKEISAASIWLSIFQLAVLAPVVLLTIAADEMIRHYFNKTQGNIFVWLYWGMALVFLLLIFFTYRTAYRKKYIASGNEEYRLRMTLADKIRKLPLSYLGRRDLSDLTTAIMDDAVTVENVLATGVTEFVSVLIFGVIAIAGLFFYDCKMSLSLFACLPFAVIVMAFSRKISEGTNKRNKQKKLDISDGLQEYLENIKVLRTSQKMAEYQNMLARKAKRIIGGLVLYEFLGGATVSLSYNIIRSGIGITVVTGSALLIGGEISLLKFLLFIFAAIRIYEPLSKACEKLGELIYSLISANRIGDLLDYPVQHGNEKAELPGYDITFDHVSFGYNQEDVIHDVSFTVKQGEITALVGPSGCGKSTLSKLAARFWDVERGSVLIGGINVNEIAPETLLKNFSIVFQDVVLFNDTIYNNIKIGKANAAKEEILAAAKLARCNDFVTRLPQGYDTVIGENGKTLSGGERQRLSIARAFLKDAPVVLLDESTASIDPENETKIQEAIGKLIKNKTVLIIAHKLRAITDCNKIIVLNEGHLLEEGTHQELMNQNGLYKKLYSLQNESMMWTAKTS